MAALLAAALVGCNKPEPDTAQVPVRPDAAAPDQQASPAPAGAPSALPPGGGFTGTVAETMDSGGYTYVRVGNGQEEIWAAAPQFAVEVGEEVTVPEGMPMANYHSETLDRDFEVVYFVATVIKGSGSAAAPEAQQMPSGAHPSVDASQAARGAGVSFTGLAAAEGGKTVGETWEQKDALSGKEVVVRGKVVKFNSQVMGKNWIHVQDGTGGEGMNDLTVTTSATASVGDTVLVEGIVTLDKDFGFGYRYDLIIEDAKVTVE